MMLLGCKKARKRLFSVLLATLNARQSDPRNNRPAA